MTDKLKEILDNIKNNYDDHYVQDIVSGNDLKQLLDYVCNLQENNDNQMKYIADLLIQITQLTNNWNELRQHIKDYLEEWENSDDEWVKGKCDMARDILYDMKEIKEGKNVSDRN